MLFSKPEGRPISTAERAPSTGIGPPFPVTHQRQITAPEKSEKCRSSLACRHSWRGAEISTPHPKASSELGYLAIRIFAQAVANVRMIAGMDTNTSAAAAIAVPATTIVVLV
jgi:hypothetical protein